MARANRLRIIIAFAALYLIWGSTYLAILFAIDSIPPFIMAGTRFLTAGLIMFGFARTQASLRSTWAEWRGALIVGACLLLGGNGGVTISEKFIPSGLASLIVATVPIYMALLSWLSGLAPRPKPIVWLGLAGGFAGVAILLGPAVTLRDANSSRAAIGISILLVSSFVWSAGSIYSSRVRHAASPFLGAAQQMFCGGILLLFVGIAAGELGSLHFGRISMLSLGAFVYLVLIGAIVGYTAYFWLLRHCEPAKVATYAYVNPIVAVILGALFAGERVGLQTLAAAALIIGSVALIITVQQFTSKAAPPIAAAVEVECAR